MPKDTALLSTTYFGPVQWYQKLNRFACCKIEQYDHFVKQTYRNRCVIPTTNGLQALSVPVEKFENHKCLLKDVRVSDHGNWRHIHWNALLSAYGESPFFEYYADDIRPFFEKKWDYLLDFNLETTAKICELLDIHPTITLTDAYVDDGDGKDVTDFREVIHPKHPQPDADFTAKPYYQVYHQKYGFRPNMSILDLLFNEGNEAVFFLIGKRF